MRRSLRSRRSAAACFWRDHAPRGGDGHPDDRVTLWTAAAAKDHARPELSRVRRPAHFARHTEPLECCFECALYSGGCGGAAAISPRSGNHRALLGDIFDWLRLVLLSLEPER